MTYPLAPLETTTLAALRTVLRGMFDAATSFTGGVSGTTLTVSAVKSGALAPGMALVGPPALLAGTIVQSFGTGTGGAGTYQLNQAPLASIPALAQFSGGFDVVRGQVNRVASPASPDYAVMWPIRRQRLATNIDSLADCRFIGAIAGTLLTVSSVSFGSISVGAPLAGTGVAAGSAVVALGTGTGGPGTYTVAPTQTIASAVLACGRKQVLQSIEMTVQIDVHGPNSGDNAQRISTLMRDEYAVQAFADITNAVIPLYADDPKQIPFVDDQSQYEDRWVVEACIQVLDVVSVPQQFADSVKISLEPVDLLFAP